jgi:tetratricopeptide (TPR) repeat protein
MSPEEAASSFSLQDQLIYLDAKVWIPVEATERTGGFLQAWEEGAKYWREYFPSQKAGFYPIHDAWKMYEPVGLPGSGAELTLPARDSILAAYLQEVMRFIDREIFPQEQKLKAEVQKSQGDVKARNRLGVLYGRYGVWDKAIAEFNTILQRQEYVPALINLANVYYLQKDWMNALSYYERAKQKDPHNDAMLLGLARVHHELENYTMAKLAYEQLKQQNAELAEQVAYLELRGDEAVRASQPGQAKERMIWQDK